MYKKNKKKPCVKVGKFWVDRRIAWFYSSDCWIWNHSIWFPLSSAFLCEVAALQRVGDSTRIYIRKISMPSGSIEYKDDDGQQKKEMPSIIHIKFRHISFWAEFPSLSMSRTSEHFWLFLSSPWWDVGIRYLYYIHSQILQHSKSLSCLYRNRGAVNVRLIIHKCCLCRVERRDQCAPLNVVGFVGYRGEK